MSHPSPKRNMVPKAVLMRSGLVSLTTTTPVNTVQPRSTVNSAMTNVFNKAHSTVRRSINKKTATKNSNFNKRVNTVSGKNVNTARPKAVVNAARPKAVLNAVKGNQVNVVKASACWVWKPKTKGNPQMDLQDQEVIESGCSRHMIGNMSYLTDFEEIDGGYVAFGGNSKGGKITGRATYYSTNGVAERKNKTLIEAARTMLADSKLPTTFWAEAVNTACYMQNRVLVIKPHNKTPYEPFLGRKPALGFMRPFGCPVIILNTIDHLGKFDGKADEGFFVESNGNAGTKACDDACKARMETVPGKDYILLPLWPADLLLSQNLKISPDAGFKPSGDNEKKVTEEQERSTPELPNDPNMPELEDIVYSDDAEDVGAEADMNNLNTFMPRMKEGIVELKNKARLVAQGTHEEEERIDYDEMDVKSAFLYGKIEEEVYVCQPPGFEDPDFPDRGYKVENALYGLHHAPKAWHASNSQKKGKMGFLSVKTSQPKLGLWYPKDSPFDLVAYIDSDYAGASLDRKSTIGGCQILRCRLISWQCKKQTVVANSITEAEYVAASSCYGQKRNSDDQDHMDKNVPDLLTKAFDINITLENVHDADMFGVHDLDGDVVGALASTPNNFFKGHREKEEANAALIAQWNVFRIRIAWKSLSGDGDDVTIKATPLSTKSPTIIDYKIYKEGKKSYFQIIRADGNSQMYLTFGKMLKNFDIEDLEVLWSIVKARFKKTEPENYMDIFLHLNLKTMFEHHLKDNVWKNQQGLVKVLKIKSFRILVEFIAFVTMQNILYYMLVEKMYQLTKHTQHQMLNDVKLQVNYECEMAFKLLRLVKK
ncbi:retrovirus-related pol polyprotein from transposon TNT 1-94 [Tanacetum coccineum]